VTVVRASDLSENQRIDSDVCICGGGPAGLTLARELTDKGYDVCVVESGEEQPSVEAQALTELETAGLPLRTDFIHRVRAIGGTSNIWSGRCSALDPIDFEERPWVAGSGWPIPYQEYERYLEPASRLLGLPGLVATVHPRDALNVVSAKPAVSTQQVGIECKLALWARKPARFWPLFKAQLETAKRCRIFLGTTVTELHLNAQGVRVESMSASSCRGKTIQLHARYFVLAMGGLENARSLMLTAEKDRRACLPRESLGRYYMDHPKTVCGAIYLHNPMLLPHLVGRRPLSDGICQPLIGLTSEVQRRERLLNAHVNLEPGYSDAMASTYGKAAELLKRLLKRGHVGSRLDFTRFESRQDFIYQLTPEELMPFALFRAMHGVRRATRASRKHVTIVNHCEQVPDRKSRIMLDQRKDAFGNQMIRLHWRSSQEEKHTLITLQRKIGHFLEERDIGKLCSDPTELATADYTDAAHHIGGTRMSLNSRSGVVDPNLKVHGMANLYVCGSSVFPTGGSANPTWSILAFALRLADHLDTVVRH
jgi:choline dehydrogenase-like flavoprotein